MRATHEKEAFCRMKWSPRQDSNLRPAAYEAADLSAELRGGCRAAPPDRRGAALSYIRPWVTSRKSESPSDSRTHPGRSTSAPRHQLSSRFLRSAKLAAWHARVWRARHGDGCCGHRGRGEELRPLAFPAATVACTPRVPDATPPPVRSSCL